MVAQFPKGVHGSSQDDQKFFGERWKQFLEKKRKCSHELTDAFGGVSVGFTYITCTASGGKIF